MSTRDLINAIAAGDAIEIESAFNSVMAEKVSARIDDMRIDVAQNLFAEEVESVEEGVNIDSQIRRKKDRIAQLKDWNTTGTFDKKIKEHQAKLKVLQAKKKSMSEEVEEIEEETEFNLEDYSLEEIESFMQTEEFEQLDELRKSTLKSYMAKVMDNAVNSTDDMSTDKKWKRLIGYHGARRRIQTGNVPKKPE